jgi:hypothetical protein
MAFARVVAVVGLLLSASSGSAHTSARTAVPIPVTTAELAAIVDSGNHHRSLLLLDIVRIIFDAPDAPESASGRLRARVMEALRTSPAVSKETVPLPLTPSLWCDAILERPVPDTELVAAILSSRQTALLYYGLSALDEETLGWLATDREALAHIRKHSGAFSAFGRSVRVRGGRVLVPGGSGAAPLWQRVIGADPANPRAFVRALFQSDRGRTAFLYDTIAHLDPPRQQFALAGSIDALAGVFRDFAREWDAELRPFARPQVDPSLLLLATRIDRDGRVAGPLGRGMWERVFRDDGAVDLAFREVAPWRASADDGPVDAAWLAGRVHEVTYTIGRRRLDTFLHAQRVFDGTSAEPHAVASVLRAFASMPALMLTLERIGVRDARTLLAAARHARAVNDAGDDGVRGGAISVFQVAVVFVERGVRSRALTTGSALKLIESLVAIPVEDGRDYDVRVAAWMRADLFRAAPQPTLESTDPVEEAVLGVLAGTASGRPTPPVEWEGQKFRVDPAAAELARLRRVRQIQGGPSLDTAIAALAARDRKGGRAGEDARRDFVAALRTVLYASQLGDPEGPALAAENVALRHNLGLASSRPANRPMNAWKLATEFFGGAEGWRVEGSLLGLDQALRRLSLRRLDPAQLPTGPTMAVLERRTAMLTTALVNPHALTDEGRDRAAAALARGRKRLEAIGSNPALLDDILADAALSEWRREALRWAIAHAPGEIADAFSIVEIFWLGGGGGLDEWGAAALPMTGCLCLTMPRPVAWEDLAGRPAAGLLASLGADVNLRLADALSARRLPAALMPAILAFAMQDVLDDARPAYLDDWMAFSRTVRAIGDARIDDYIAALAADGPLVPASRGTF